MLPPRLLSAADSEKFRAPGLWELSRAWTEEPHAAVGGGAPDSAFSRQRFRNLLYVGFVGPRKTLVQLRNLCRDWLQPQTRSKEEIVELLVLEQYLSILPERVKPWVRAREPGSCEKLVTLLESYQETSEQEDEDIPSDDDLSRTAAESPPPRSEPSFCGDLERRSRSRDVESPDHWLHARTSLSRRSQHDLSLPLMETTFGMDADDGSDRDSVMDFTASAQDVESCQNVVGLTEDGKPPNPIRDNMENYRELLSLGVRLAEDDRHTHLTQGHSSRSKRSAHPSPSRGLRTMPEAKRPSRRRGICGDVASHGLIMEKFIRDVSCSSESERARDTSDQPPRFPRMTTGWTDVSLSQRESVIQERGCEGRVLGGGVNPSCDLTSRKQALRRKRRYQSDAGKGLAHNQRGCVRKKSWERSKSRRVAGKSGLSLQSPAVWPPAALGAAPYMCDECARPFSVISEFVEHQIMHTRESLYEYGESFIHSVAVSEVQRGRAQGRRPECKASGEALRASAPLAERRRGHVRDHLTDTQDQEFQEAFLPSPTFNELQKMYSKEKFYECRVCKETFLHSSALVDHQNTHGSDSTDHDHPSSALRVFQKVCGKGRACAETGLHGPPLVEHQNTRVTGTLSENQGGVCKTTFLPGQSFHRQQKAHTQEQFREFKDSGNASTPSSGLSERLWIRSRENLCEGRRFVSSVIHSAPCSEPQKSHTITRPSASEEVQRALTISTSPEEQRQRCPAKESVWEGSRCEGSVIHRLAFTDPQKSHSAAELSPPTVTAQSPVQSVEAIACPRAHAGESACDAKVCGRSVIQSRAAAETPRRHTGDGPATCNDGGEPSVHISDPAERQLVQARGSPFEEAKYNKYTVIHSVSYARPPRLPAGEGPSELKKKGDPTPPDSQVREYHKACEKKKYIECRDTATSVIHSPVFGEPQDNGTRESVSKYRERGVSFTHNSDLSEHQNVRGWEEPSGSKSYERSVIRSLALVGTQTSPAEEGERHECRQCGKCFATSDALSRHQKIYGRERVHSRMPFGSSVIRGVGLDAPQENEVDDTIYECKDCGLGFANWSDLGDHRQVHGRECLIDSRVCGPSVIQTCSFGNSQQSGSGDKLYECLQCGQSFVSDMFLFEHQKLHEREPFFFSRQDNEAWMRRLTLPTQRGRRSSRKGPSSLKTLRCQVCGQDFIHISVLHEHMKIHTGEDVLDRGKVCEDTIVPGLTLTEFQRSQTEEKSYACETCGESFLRHPDLRDHMRVHEKDRPFDYGAMFVHTSFGSELPNPDSPFYECKDCGKSFIHSTILVKHQQLHLEEAAQEAEANVVIPQEVLRIQGSRVEAAEPEGEATEPNGEAERLNREATECSGEAERLDREATECSGEATRPSGDAEEPDGAGTEDPEERAEGPEGDAEEPVDTETEALEEEGRDQEIQVEEPYCDCQACAKTLISESACREYLKSRARVIMYEPGRVYGESSRYTQHASAGNRPNKKYFRCGICGQLFSDRLSLARHQNSHNG